MNVNSGNIKNKMNNILKILLAILIIGLTAKFIGFTNDVDGEDKGSKIKKTTKEIEKLNKIEVADDKYWLNYGYSILDNKEDKITYDIIYNTLLNCEDKALLNTLDQDKAYYVYDLVIVDHPEIFWTDSYSLETVSLNGVNKSISIKPNYTMTNAEIDKYKKQLQIETDNIIGNITNEMTDYDISKYLYDYLIKNVEYNLEAENNQTLVSALVDKETVCMGYAKAYEYLLRKAGIESTIVSGYGNDEAHAWNIVKLDNNWYYTDVTWGNIDYDVNSDILDKIYNEKSSEDYKKCINYCYLNITEEDLLKSHSIDDKFEIPKCNSTEDNYFIKENRYINKLDNNEIKNMIVNCKDEVCSIRFSNENDFKSAIKFISNANNICDKDNKIKSYSYSVNKDLLVIMVYTKT